MVGPHRNTYICPQETWYWDSGNITEVVMSGVQCTGTELSLDQCAHHGTHITCKRTETRFTAGVICSESEWKASEEGGFWATPFRERESCNLERYSIPVKNQPHILCGDERSTPSVPVLQQ